MTRDIAEPDVSGGHPAGGLILLSTYIILSVIGVLASYFIGLVIESRVPAWSLFAFLGMFLGVLVLAWPMALMLTKSYGPGWKPRDDLK